MTEYAFEGPRRSSTIVTWSFATHNYSADSAAPFSASISAAYQAAVQAAFDHWASVSGLSFVQVQDDPTAAIRVGFGVLPLSNEVGETIVRSVNGYLPADTVVRLLDPRVAPLVADSSGTYFYAGTGVTLTQIATHEIGHALGLDHDSDPVTVMYPIVSASNPTLAAGDIAGINELYPLFTVASANPALPEGDQGVTPFTYTVTRHDDLSLAASVNYQVSGAAGVAGEVAAAASAFAGGVYPTGTLVFAPGVATVALTVPVLGNLLPQADEGFALSFSPAGGATSATARGTLSGTILDDDSSAAISGNALSVYRFFDQADGTHFFTASIGERNSLVTARPDLVYEGADLGAVAYPGADAAAVPVFRFFDTIHGTHFYTDSATERNVVLSTRADLSFEGIGFYEHVVAQAGDAPVFRFFDTASGTQFLTQSASERATITATLPRFVDEGVAFYAPTSPA